MSTPADTDSTESGPDIRPSPLVLRTFGEPRFHTDGEIAAIAFGADGTVWSIDETGILLHWSPDGLPLSRAFLSDLETLWCFAPNAQLLASSNDDLLIWNPADGQLLKQIEQSSWVTALAFHPNCTTLATGHDDGAVCVWDTRTFQLLGRIVAHPKSVSALAYAPNGEAIATAGEDRVIRVWDTATHQQRANLKSHTDRIPALIWNALGTQLISAGWDTSARVWNPPRSEPLILLNSHAEQVTTLAAHPTTPMIATADSDYDIHLWPDPARGRAEQVLHGHIDEIHSLAFSPDGHQLASAGADRVIHLWDTATGALLAGPNPKNHHPIAVFPSGGTLFLASAGGPGFRLWNTHTGAEIASDDDISAECVAADPQGRWLAVGGSDTLIRLYDLAESGTPPRLLEATKPPIGELAFSPSGHLLAHASPSDGLVWLWNPADAKSDAVLILIEAADGCTLEGLAFHPDGQRLAVGGIDYLSTGERDGAVCIWDLSTKLKTVTFDLGVYSVAFDPSGRYLAGAGVTDRVYVWDLVTQELIFELEGHTETIRALTFSPDGSYLLSGGDDMTVRVWDVLSGRLLMARAFDSVVQALHFSPDGHMLFMGNGNTTCSQIEFKRLLDD
ncbi:MAG: WD40 repeat domain-containing protein [Bacteroidales bacterium]|nr:WD40 repeat domain-containing protein [Bacteroidales bacterium]